MTDPIAQATATLIDALGLTGTPDVDGTPARVAQLWRETLANGYQSDPAQILADQIDDTSGATVTVTDLPFHCICPHHLLPAVGVAHVAFVPNGRIVGFGQIEALVRCLSRRLVLQEHLTASIADALMTHLDARGAACALSAEHLCLALRGHEPRGARVHTRVARGCLIGQDGLPGAHR